MTKQARKKEPFPTKIDYRHAAQLSALRALALSFSDRSASSARLFAETFLEYVLQIFEADGAYLEFSPPSSSESETGIFHKGLISVGFPCFRFKVKDLAAFY